MNNVEFEKLIKSVPDFPKKGVIFKDISPLLEQKFNEVIEHMSKDILWDDIDVVIGIESRGFILGSAMAMLKNKGFVPMRKKGKLPPPVIGESYELEYGTDTLELQANERPLKAVLVDDVLATGGTLRAALNLCAKNNYQIQSVNMLINLKFLNKFDQELDSLKSVLNYE